MFFLGHFGPISEDDTFIIFCYVRCFSEWGRIVVFAHFGRFYRALYLLFSATLGDVTGR